MFCGTPLLKSDIHKLDLKFIFNKYGTRVEFVLKACIEGQAANIGRKKETELAHIKCSTFSTGRSARIIYSNAKTVHFSI